MQIPNTLSENENEWEKNWASSNSTSQGFLNFRSFLVKKWP